MIGNQERVNDAIHTINFHPTCPHLAELALGGTLDLKASVKAPLL